MTDNEREALDSIHIRLYWAYMLIQRGIPEAVDWPAFKATLDELDLIIEPRT